MYRSMSFLELCHRVQWPECRNVTSFAVTTLSANTNYFYRLRATNTGGTSVNSGISSAYARPWPLRRQQRYLSAQTAFNANWSASPGATGYFLDVATDTLFTLPVSDSTIWPSVWLRRPLSHRWPPTRNTFYRVRAANSGGTSAQFVHDSAVDRPAPPTATAAGSIASTSFNANWSASAGATAYRSMWPRTLCSPSILPSYNNLTSATW